MAISSPSEYQYLGRKTFTYWFLRRSVGAIVVFFVSIVLSTLATTVLPQVIFGITIPWTIIVLGVFSLSLFMFVGAFIGTRFMYANNRFALDEDALRIRRGIVNQEELAIPYRQIQSVNIERTYSYQTFGLSRLVILTAGQGFGKEGEGGEANEVFSAIDADVATWLQGELLKRINVQKVTEVP